MTVGSGAVETSDGESGSGISQSQGPYGGRALTHRPSSAVVGLVPGCYHAVVSAPPAQGPRRLAWPRTLPFQGRDRGFESRRGPHPIENATQEGGEDTFTGEAIARRDRGHG